MRSLIRSGMSPGVAGAAMFVLLATMAPASADVVVVGPSRDNTLIEDLSGSLSNGAGDSFFAGRTEQPSGSIRRGLVVFDLRAVPKDATITSAVLTLHVSETTSGAARVNLHRVASDWGEGGSVSPDAFGSPARNGDATWVHTFFSNRFWAIPGGDFLSSLHGTSVVDQPGFYTWGPTDAMTSDVVSWLGDPATNHGWMLIGEERSAGSLKRFDSREFPDAAFRPTLTIEFSIPCAHSTGAPGAGYWRRQCLAVPAVDGGLELPGSGRGPRRATEEGFVDQVLPCAGSMLAGLGFHGTGACGALDDRQATACHPIALRRLAALVFDVCAGHLSPDCPLNGGAGGCGARSVGELIGDVADRIHAGDCQGALRCSGD